MALNSASLSFAPLPVTSLSSCCVPTFGTYFSACVNTLNTTRVGLDATLSWFLNSFPAASVAT